MVDYCYWSVFIVYLNLIEDDVIKLTLYLLSCILWIIQFIWNIFWSTSLFLPQDIQSKYEIESVVGDFTDNCFSKFCS